MTNGEKLSSHPDCDPGRLTALDELSAEDAARELTDALAAVCDIHGAELRVYLAVLDHPRSTSSEIADVLERDQSNTGMRLKRLAEEGLVERSPRPVDNGGVQYLYVAQSLADTEAWLERELEAWTETVLSQLMRLEEP